MEPKEQFYNSLEEEMGKLHLSKRATFVIEAAQYDDILYALKLKKGEPCDKGAQFKQWAVRNFNIVTIGSVDYVYSQNDKDDTTSNRQVAKKEEIFDIIQR